MALQVFSGLETVSVAAGDKVIVQDATTGVLQVGLVGVAATADAAAATAAALTDSSGGSADATVAAISGSGADSDINNNFADVAAQINALITDVADIRTQLNALLAEAHFIL